ncbi:flavodoxin family protein [Desulfobacula toluolica]|uniref:NADPH-dependent FMN reductase n=1 Tax=Desulfobacula toluolica (strain DSM 7467 / Tol2) TaxID=651182 RepID=K0NS41_DESTT|nr:flavodoxin family protein [Desulfobacula toluolica]CCK81802.1 NADPH-dependent FMN reductase [Desulfobacula toluolica Tol2]
MLVLGINGSPRHKGNSHYLMDRFMKEMESKGHDTQVLNAVKMKINPCIGCGHCEKKGVCIFEDDFTHIFLPEVIKADIIVISSPVYFYGFPAAIKALIDRIQVLWSRKYRLKKDEFKGRKRKGFLLAVGATRGEDLFDGLKLTARYFFDAADIEYETALCYRGIDEKGGIKNHLAVNEEINNLVAGL